MYNADERMILGTIVIVYFFILFGISLYINKKSIHTYDDYNVAGRSVSLFPLILTFVGTAIGGSTLLGYMENGYTLGMGQQWLNLGSFTAELIMLGFFLKKIRQYGDKYNMVTVADFTVLRFGEGARWPTVLSILVAYSAITGMQFVAIATILNLTVGFSMVTGIIVSWVLLTIKTYFGGMKSVIWQDAVHGTMQTVGLFILFFVVLVASGGPKRIAENAALMNESSHLSIFTISPTEVFIYILTIGGYQFVRQDLWQRYWAASSAKTAKRSYSIAVFLSMFLGCAVIMIGVMAKYGLLLDVANPRLTYYEVIGHVFSFPMIVMMIIALLATVISTADSFFMAGASSIVNDLVRPKMKVYNDQKLLFYSRLSVIAVSFFALILALYIPQLVNLWITGTAMLVSSLLAPVICGLFWKATTKKAAVTAMWVGLVIAVTWQLLGHPFGIHPVFLGLPISAILVVGMTALAKEKNTVDYLNDEVVIEGEK